MVDVRAVVDDDVIVDEEEIEVVLSEERPFLSMAFVEALIGMAADEVKEFRLPLPETIDEPSLRGAEADFTVKVTKVFSRVLPDLDDALASTAGTFETLAELEQDIRERLQSSKQGQAESAYQSKVAAQLVDQATVVYPPQLIEDTLDDIVAEAKQQVEGRRSMTFEDALRLDGLTIEQFRDQMRPQAEQRAKRSLVLSEFAEVEGIGVSDDDVVQEYHDLYARLNIPMPSREMSLNSPLGQNLRSSVLGRKVMEHLSRIGRGEQPEPEAEPEATADEAAS
jgi:trigger factor